MSEQMSDLEQKMQQQVLRYEYVLEALSDIGDELCRVSSFDAQLKSLLHLLLGTLGVRKGGIFLFENYSKCVSLRCSWKLVHKTYDFELNQEEVKTLEDESAEITYRVKDFTFLKSCLQDFIEDNLTVSQFSRLEKSLSAFSS